MFLNVRDMEVRPILFDLVYSPGEVDLLDASLTQLSGLTAQGRADLLAAVEEIRVRGRLAVTVGSACERCLEPAEFQVERSFDLFYRPATASVAPAGELALQEGEIEIAFYEGDGLDLKEVLREQVLLSLPMQRLCRPSCRGLCPVCGGNRNLVDCSCVREVADDRWAALRRFSVATKAPS